VDLHPYDDEQRRFRHDDLGDQSAVRGLVERLLHLPIGGHVLRYDLAFFSGGIGIIDDLFISIDAAEAWRATPPDGFLRAEDALARDDCWPIDDDEDQDVAPDAALQAFITDHRAPFQAPAYDQVWIEADSDWNSWTVAYTYQRWLHWMSHDQG
jgi:hypothetical protein